MPRRSCNLLPVLILGSLIIFSCNKKKGNPDNTPPRDTSAVSSSNEDSLKYLMYNTMQVSFVDGGRNTDYDLPTYYWYNQVPALSPMSSQYASADDLLSKMIGYPVVNGKPVDRYSFLDRTGNIADQIQNGVVDGVFSGLGSTGDFGLEVSFAQADDGSVKLMVLYADLNSPAGKKGIQRGWQIISVNGNDNLNYDGPDGKNVNTIYNAIYNADKVDLSFKKPDNTTVSFTLNAVPYEVNPILFDTIYVRNNKKIGYFVFYTFSSTEDNKGNPTHTRQILDQEFGKLKAAGINDLIVDLRYNGGGAVTTAAYLDSAIAPASANGKVMYQYLYNDKLSKKSSLLGLTDKIMFDGTGGLNLDHVFFIVTSSTASASELTINNLKPYMDVKMVGSKTYGKPVGFIDFTLSDYDSLGKENYLADLYAINFETKNAAGVGGYFDGIEPDVTATDYIDVPWGDPSDDNLAKILNFISTGSFARLAATERLQKPSTGYYRMMPPKAFSSLRFNGMVDYGLSRKIQSAIRNKH